MKVLDKIPVSTVCYFDGCAEPINPCGNMGIGAVIFHNNKIVFRYSHYIPKHFDNSNNVAEYLGVIKILEWLLANNLRSNILIYGDSKLVINQMNGFWKIKQGRYVPYALTALALRKQFKKRINFRWIPREKNHFADSLSKQKLLDNGIEFRIQPLEKSYMNDELDY